MDKKVNVLETIIQSKRVEVDRRKKEKPLDEWIDRVKPSKRSLKHALEHSGNRFILEYKRASPSKGDIRPDLTPLEVIRAYEPCADAISVLTDETFFKGNHQLLSEVAQATTIPVLCKDFFIDEYQVYEARYFHGDAILLMLSVLDDETYLNLSHLASVLNLDVLTEVHTEEELSRALSLNAEIVGINNRDLTTLTTDLSVTERLAPKIPKHKIVISESGLSTRADVNRLAHLVNGFLIGTSLTSSDNIAEAAKTIVYGSVKICGIKDIDTARCCFQSGATYVGLVFYPKSPRNLLIDEAEHIIEQLPGKYVGVFVNDSIGHIKAIAERCRLNVVQLHGSESPSFVQELKNVLSPDVNIWKALSLKHSDDIHEIVRWSEIVDKVVIDYQNQQEYGGTGNRFDWTLLSTLFEHVEQHSIVVAGGINKSNIRDLFQYSEVTLDLSSGVEFERGLKSTRMIESFFDGCRMNGYQ